MNMKRFEELTGVGQISMLPLFKNYYIDVLDSSSEDVPVASTIQHRYSIRDYRDMESHLRRTGGHRHWSHGEVCHDLCPGHY